MRYSLQSMWLNKASRDHNDILQLWNVPAHSLVKATLLQLYDTSRVRLSIAQKRQVIQMLKSGSAVLMVAKQFNIGPQTVRDIKKKESELDRYEIN